MPTPTYVALDKKTITVATSSITFTGIDQTYTDLVIVCNAGSASGQALLMRVNGDTGSNYSELALYGNGSTAACYLDNNTTFAEIGGIWNSWGNTTINLMNYSVSNTYKSVITRNNDATYRTQLTLNMWRSDSAITSVEIFPNSGVNFNVGSTFSLYGIRAQGASPTPKATGGIISADSTYYYHTFTTSGTFTPFSSLTADILVVAGGGGGASRAGGGGGAGGLLGFNSQSLSATGYAVTIGGGGAGGGGATTGGVGSTGGDSQFGALTLVKGGGWGINWLSGVARGAAGTGGSGGGATMTANGTTSSAGSGTPGQGYDGGGQGGAGGGGGGAGGVGVAGSGTGGQGGVGLSTYNTWSQATGIGQYISSVDTYYIAGGGGGGVAGNNFAGGAGGYGGGGFGNAGTGTNNPAGNGVLATGGGGGGAGNNGDSSSVYGGNGGSGVVIVRYLK